MMIDRRLSAIALSLICAPTLLSWSAMAQSQNCFLTNTPPSIPILQQAPPPESDKVSNYKYFPATMFASMDLAKLAASHSRLPKYFWQWGNHGPRRKEHANLAPRVMKQTSPTKLNFSSPSTADACTLAQTATLLGMDERARDYAARGPVTLATTPEPGSYTDTCIVWDTRLPANVEGILLDYEVFDGRTPDHTRDFLLEYARLVHDGGKKVILYTNPLDAPSQVRTGVHPSNARQLMNAFDKMAIFLWSGNKQHDIASSFEAQMAVLGSPDPSKLMAVFELNHTTLEDAATVRDLVLKNRVSSVTIWRNYAEAGGSCDSPENQKVNCLAYGHCGATQGDGRR